jgi:hypothetical protein
MAIAAPLNSAFFRDYLGELWDFLIARVLSFKRPGSWPHAKLDSPPRGSDLQMGGWQSTGRAVEERRFKSQRKK